MNPVYFNNQLTSNKTRTVFFSNTYKLITQKYSYFILKKIHLTGSIYSQIGMALSFQFWKQLNPTPSTRCGLAQYFSVFFPLRFLTKRVWGGYKTRRYVFHNTSKLAVSQIFYPTVKSEWVPQLRFKILWNWRFTFVFFFTNILPLGNKRVVDCFLWYIYM